MSNKKEVIISGRGGQGVVLAGVILGNAAFKDGKNVVQTQSYGAEARGTAAWSNIIISEDRINYPRVTECDALIALSAEAARKFSRKLKKGGLLIIDSMTAPAIPEKLRKKSVKVAATSIAENKLGSRIYANMIVLGALIKLTSIVSYDSVVKALIENLPPDKLEKNLQALKLGYESAINL